MNSTHVIWQFRIVHKRKATPDQSVTRHWMAIHPVHKCPTMSLYRLISPKMASSPDSSLPVCFISVVVVLWCTCVWLFARQSHHKVTWSFVSRLPNNKRLQRFHLYTPLYHIISPPPCTLVFISLIHWQPTNDTTTNRSTVSIAKSCAVPPLARESLCGMRLGALGGYRQSYPKTCVDLCLKFPDKAIVWNYNHWGKEKKG